VQDAIEARRSALEAAASNQQSIASKDSANATYAAIPALLSSVQALIVPDMPADLRALVEGFVDTIDEKEGDAFSAFTAIRVLYKASEIGARDALAAAEAEPADKVAAARAAVDARIAEQTTTKTGKAVSAARTAAEAAKTSAEAAITNYYNTTQQPSTMPP